ncbi:MAG: biotin/lipoyl-binding protein, partial [Clostridiales bacterium]|nr:biotin/lipoyl-binding protein [Clostridiales bacterium]
MANPVLMPKQGITVESCILTKWAVKVGDTVKKGDVLFSYETDKSSFDQESEFDGEVLALFCEEGDEVPVLTNVCAIGKKGEDVSAFSSNGVTAGAQEVTPVAATPAPAAAPAPVAMNPNVKPVMMPKQGITVESCILTKWAVKVGDTVKKGDVLFSYETDKSSFDQESEFDGDVLALFCEEGDEVAVLTNVCAIGPKGEDASCYAPGGAVATATEVAASVAAEKVDAPVATTAPANAEGRIFASPRAKKLAEKLGVDLASATPTGPNGRIIERDI